MKSKNASQISFTRVNGWGGKRSGAGRPNRSGTVNHMSRPRISLAKPLHLTLKLNAGTPGLRSKSLFKEFKKSVRLAKKFRLYVIHFSVQNNHVHLIAESPSNRALGLGMKSLAGRFAKSIKRHAENSGKTIKGTLFKGRYHVHILRTPREVKNALEYVLLNLSKHQQFIDYIDHFSSGFAFKHWKPLLGKRFSSLLLSQVESLSWCFAEDDLTSVVSQPRSWLVSTGWMRACG